MLFFNIYFLFPMRFCTEIRDERQFLSLLVSVINEKTVFHLVTLAQSYHNKSHS